jgi:hypothetical protein
MQEVIQLKRLRKWLQPHKSIEINHKLQQVEAALFSVQLLRLARSS